MSISKAEGSSGAGGLPPTEMVGLDANQVIDALEKLDDPITKLEEREQILAFLLYVQSRPNLEEIVGASTRAWIHNALDRNEQENFVH